MRFSIARDLKNPITFSISRIQFQFKFRAIYISSLVGQPNFQSITIFKKELYIQLKCLNAFLQCSGSQFFISKWMLFSNYSSFQNGRHSQILWLIFFNRDSKIFDTILHNNDIMCNDYLIISFTNPQLKFITNIQKFNLELKFIINIKKIRTSNNHFIKVVDIRQSTSLLITLHKLIQKDLRTISNIKYGIKNLEGDNKDDLKLETLKFHH